jgi:hypothetical protein
LAFVSGLSFDTSKTLYIPIRTSCTAYDTISDTLWIHGTNGTGQFFIMVRASVAFSTSQKRLSVGKNFVGSHDFLLTPRM